MSKKGIFLDVPTLYRKQALDLIMYGFVNGIMTGLPSMDASEAIRIFIERNKFNQDDFPFESAQTTFYRMRTEFIKEGGA